MADFDNKIGGPAQAQYADTDVGHTSGGITITVTPQNREVTVDEFGQSACNIRHTGDTVKFTVPFAEFIAAQVAKIYNPGNDQTAATPAYMGIGRTAGYIYTTADFKAVPYLTADVAKRAQFYRATAVGEFSLTHNVDDDLVIEVEHAALVDESQVTDGEYIGKLQISP